MAHLQIREQKMYETILPLCRSLVQGSEYPGSEIGSAEAG